MNKYNIIQVSNSLGVSQAIVAGWEKSGKLVPIRCGKETYYTDELLQHLDIFKQFKNSTWDQEQQIKPNRNYTSIELFAGAGGLALGLEQAGFKVALLNEMDKHAGNTLKENRPDWNVTIGNVTGLDFSHFKDKIDFLSGGFPCQAFSYAGNKQGFGDTRGTLFFEFARAIEEIRPRVFLAENVRGLLSHENGRTIETIKHKIKEIGYTLIEPEVLKAIYYRVPQKRERLFLIGIRNDLAEKFNFAWPSKYNRVMTVKDALKKGELFNCDVPESKGQTYPQRKKEILDLVPPGGYWRNLTDDIQREYMKKSYFLGGGKTGMARRLSWYEPSLTLTCSPAQKQTERCHPDKTRPLTVREYARIQTFPDNWAFSGPLTSQYKQIGNAVPVNLAKAVGTSLISLLNSLENNKPSITYPIENLNIHPQQMNFLWEKRAKYLIKSSNFGY
ncbi:MAG: DNA (cytosine-5-)-methyltransferase [Colwellia sp.]|nr:DNA (cytosine-5-)-methyltransferase [Colwellia sp.]